jgi:actin-related protein
LQAVAVHARAGADGADEAAKKDYEYSFDLSRYAEGAGMRLPVTDGLITDWDWLERVWEHAMADTLRADNKDTPVLMTEKVFNPSSNRQRYFL